MKRKMFKMNLGVQVRFTRAFKGLISPPSEPPGEIMSFGVSPVNYSDSDSDSESQEKRGKIHCNYCRAVGRCV